SPHRCRPPLLSPGRLCSSDLTRADSVGHVSESGWRRVQDEVRSRVDAFAGIAGIALRDLGAGREWDCRGNEIFPVASTIKVAILLAVLDAADRGQIDLTQRVRITANMRTP